ncbi:MAG: class I SAM-dependent methyltransferase [Fimbriimonadaceae bacterium]|nr:class I SAM-dependent methyltransferase [Fimbriimonadaceae bacterium]
MRRTPLMAIDERRRTSFDEAAEAYARSRPGYPDALFDAIFEYGGLRSGDSALEIGCGPGQATVPMARRGLRIVAVDPGARLVEVNRSRTRDFEVAFEIAKYEDWDARGRTFDLAYAGSSFHWVDPDVRFGRAADHLRPGGTVALFGNKHVRALDDDGFFECVQELYERHLPDLTRRSESLPEAETVESAYPAEIQSSGRFEGAEVRRFRWDLRFSADDYVRLLDTYSDHHVLPEAIKSPFYEAIRALIEDRFGGTVNRGYLSLLCLGRRA